MRGLLLLLSAAAGLGYLVFPGSALLKGACVTLLAVMAMLAGRRLLALALFLSSCGDVILALGSGYFLAGLSAFLCAHLVYIALFLKHSGKRRRLVFPALLLLYGVVFGAWLAPSLGALRIPVFCYIAAILAMAAAAYRANHRSPLVLYGAILFLISDSLLGAARFKTPVPFSGILVWITYYCAQCAITIGELSEGPTLSFPRARPEPGFRD
jgi:uncharacterized membrane protein YhhN